MELDQSAAIHARLGDRYSIEREIGRGGMATVYLADDLKHRRKVAVKVLRPDLAASMDAERFIREISTVARLSHPHILPLYDSGAIDDVLYYVMPFIRGESLRQKLTRERRLAITEAIAIARQVASALAFAHFHGVIHRDIKPENILLHEGEALLADFGIALARQPDTNGRLTATGMLLGTPDYMSPEQSVGEPVLDARSDVYSLGCVLYEMLTGELPHRGPNAQSVFAKRLTSPAPSVRRLRGEVSLRLDRALAKALATDPVERFDSATAIAEALVDGEVLVQQPPSVAILPFLNLSTDPENEYFADGITEDVIAQLSKIRSLKVISRTSVMQFKKRETSLREIGAALEATTILEGSVRRAGNRVRIVGQLIDVETDRHLWVETYDRQLTDIFAIQTDVALQIAVALRAELTRDERSRIKREPTANLEAYQLYLQGRFCFIRFTAESIHTSIQYFDRAIEKDPDYAMAYVGLALAYNELGEGGSVHSGEAYLKSKAAALRALSIDSELGDAHCALAVATFVCDFDWASAEREFKRALELTPGSADTYDLYGRFCSSLQRFDEAIALTKRAQELDPLVHKIDLATAYLRAGAYDEAIPELRRAIERDPHNARAHATLAWAYVKQNRFTEGLTGLKTAVSLAPGATIWLAQLGQVFAMAGDTGQARDVLRQLDEQARTGYVSPYHFAYVYTGLGEQDRAMDYLERAYNDRAGAVYGIKGSFLFTALHSNPRFTALLGKMNLA